MKHIFILEDDQARIDIYEKIYNDCRLTIVRKADEAISILKSSSPTEFDLITLDHDLGNEVYCPSDDNSGYWVAKYISEHRHFDCPIVIHSWNPAGAFNMANKLPKAVRIPFSTKYYSEPCAGNSIPAAEHSTITSWGREREREAYDNMLNQYPNGYVAVVSDSYDIFNACSKIWGEELRSKVDARDGVVVIRPDSGVPVDVIMGILPILAEKFGYTNNAKGYKVLNPKVRVIQGDGVNINSIQEILYAMLKGKWSADNIAFGMGGKLLQGVDRDTNKFAFKCSAQKRNGVWFDIMKNPLDTSKASKRGRLGVIWDAEGQLITVNQNDGRYSQEHDLLKPVFYNGHIVNNVTIDDLRRSW